MKNVQIIDLYFLVISLKKSAPYPLIPKYGEHWNTYGATFAATASLKVLARYKNNQVNSLTMRKIPRFQKIRKFTDDDYLASLNLMIKWKNHWYGVSTT